MAFEFGILQTDKIRENTLEKTNCDVILTKENRVRMKEVEGVKGYYWEDTDHRLGLCEVEHTVSVRDFVYKQTKCEGSYPVVPLYMIDAIKYGRMIDRNDHQIRVDKDDKILSKIQVQPYLGDAYFSPEYYIATFFKREPLPIHVDMIRDYIGKRINYFERELSGGVRDANLEMIVEKWKDNTYKRIEGEKATMCVRHEPDSVLQMLKKMRFGMLYPNYYMLNTDYIVTESSKEAPLNRWLVKEKTVGKVKAAEAFAGNSLLKSLASRMEDEELSREIIIAVINYGSKFGTRSGKKKDLMTIDKLEKYCDSLTTFVHKKKRDEGDDETARAIIRNQWIKGMPSMNLKKEMKVSRGPIQNWSFFMSLEMFKRNNKVDIDPNHDTWKNHVKEIRERMQKEQSANSNSPLKIQVDGVSLSTGEFYGTVEHWIDWVVDLIMLAQVKRLIKEYKFVRLETSNLMAGMNKLVGALRCYAYCLILALYDFYGADIEGFEKGSNSSAIVETVVQMFPNFKQEIQANFGINLNIKDKKQALFVRMDMDSEFSEDEQKGYMFEYGWAKREEQIWSNYGDILTDLVEQLYKSILNHEEWEKIVDDPEKYFYDDLFNASPETAFISKGYDPDNNIVIEGKVGQDVTYFSKRFVSYWYRVRQVQTSKGAERRSIEDVKYREFDIESFKPYAIGEIGIHASTYKYQDLLAGRNRGEKVKDSQALVWYDFALTNYTLVRPQDRCWIMSCTDCEYTLRFATITMIFERLSEEADLSYHDILLKVREYPIQSFASYKHFYVRVLQHVFRDNQEIDVLEFCTRMLDPRTREAGLNKFSRFRQWRESEFLIDALKMNFLLWVVFELENIDVDYSKKRHPLLISTDKGLRVVSVDLFNSMLSVSLSGWIPYVERVCERSEAKRRLNADELKLKNWFIAYYVTLPLLRRAEPRMSFKYEGITTWIGSNCGGVRDYLIQMLPARKPKPGVLILAYGAEINVAWLNHALRDILSLEGSLGIIIVSDGSVVNKSKLRVRDMKIYNRGEVDRLILISSGDYTFGNKYLLSKLMAKIEQ
ncbi:major outer capsid protein [African horse sickness virus 9]|uniref:Outer capsid protein VP2 n=1 Tax=African horse sickness virus 9 TaxID=10897 RepID=A0A189RMU2_AHSV9|nr:major outer capsid protein [African horse sickness virus 9]ALM00130.1 major outer capsid protein [African horse sickness virus 9]